jgi:hypothetical protein
MPIACAVALVLLLDASGSVSTEDWRMQASGTADAIADEAVVRIIERQGAVAMTAIAFSDETRPLVPWRIITSRHEAEGFANALREAPRSLFGGTRIGEAMDDALVAFDAAPCEAEQEVVDISSDGDADPTPTGRARDAAAQRGVRVNAIGIGRLPGSSPADWLRDNAITMGGFALSAGDWSDFARAMRRKLAMELASR